jgi:DNA polymerase-1
MINQFIPGDPRTPKKIAFLVPPREFNKKSELNSNYVQPLKQLAVNPDEIIFYNLDVAKNGITSAGKARTYLDKLYPILSSAGIKIIVICDRSYFKAATRTTKPDEHLGYIYKFQGWMYAWCPPFTQGYLNPLISKDIILALKAVGAQHTGSHLPFAFDPLMNVSYPSNYNEVQTELSSLMDEPIVAFDIETYDLRVDQAGLRTIAFAPSKDRAVSIICSDNESVMMHQEEPTRELLKDFFQHYTGTLVAHNGTFDSKVLIWELFMEHDNDIEGLLEGLEAMYRDLVDTHTLAYLALNSAGGNSLSLKRLAYPFLGHWDFDFKNKQIPMDMWDLLKYNALDAIATMYVYDTYRPVVQAEQEDVYQNVFRPSEKTICQMELTGLPLHMGRVLKVEQHLEDVCRNAEKTLCKNAAIIEFEDKYRELQAQKATAKLKKLIKTKDDFLHVSFNPNSNPQLQLLLYRGLGLPVLKTTPSGAPASGAEVLGALAAHEAKNLNRPEVLEILESLVALGKAGKILNSFIPAFKTRTINRQNWIYLAGSYNLGGTVSGRLSSSEPNMQNLPSTGTQYAKSIKKCFTSPKDLSWLFVGADFFSLEDRISALQTKDPNKLKVYTDGYDGHSLRAYSYFADQMPDITKELEGLPEGPQRVATINSIAIRYPTLRQHSKGPTFALTYGGTYKTLIENFGIDPAEAMEIEKQYHLLYSVSDQWVRDQIKFAHENGYVELAFGLRLRTPGIARVVDPYKSGVPYEIKKEIKTAGNALGQSYGLLNSHAANQFMQRVWAHSIYRTCVLPAAQIHDSQYYMVKNNLDLLKWVNDNLIDCMSWNQLPEIYHPQVGLGAELEIFFPSWADPIGIPNNASVTDIHDLLKRSISDAISK